MSLFLVDKPNVPLMLGDLLKISCHPPHQSVTVNDGFPTASLFLTLRDRHPGFSFHAQTFQARFCRSSFALAGPLPWSKLPPEFRLVSFVSSVWKAAEFLRTPFVNLTDLSPSLFPLYE